MSSVALKRIVMDISEYMKEPIENTYIHFDESNLFEVYLLIIGPDKTPYEGGFYFFKINFPTDFPYKYPEVKFLTTAKNIRFNPNLYENGKVCLSILGTWSGPEWSCVMTLSSIILSLQSLFTEHPLRNEPGFDTENEKSERNLNYNAILTFYNWSFAILEMLTNPVVTEMKDTITQHFLDHKSKYLEKLNLLQEEFNELINVKSIYGMNCTIDYKQLSLKQLTP